LDFFLVVEPLCIGKGCSSECRWCLACQLDPVQQGVAYSGLHHFDAAFGAAVSGARSFFFYVAPFVGVEGVHQGIRAGVCPVPCPFIEAGQAVISNFQVGWR